MDEWERMVITKHCYCCLQIQNWHVNYRGRAEDYSHAISAAQEVANQVYTDTQECSTHGIINTGRNAPSSHVLLTQVVLRQHQANITCITRSQWS